MFGFTSLASRLSSARQHAASGGWGMAEYVAYPFMMFAATPAFLHLLGPVQYGQWMLLLTFNSFGGLAGLGMGAAAIKEVSAANGRGSPEESVRAVRACVTVTLLGSLAVGSSLLLVGWLVGPTLLSRMGDPSVVHTIIGLAALLIALEQLDGVFAGALRGRERFDLAAQSEVLAKFALIVGALIAAWWTRDVFAVLATAAVLTLARLVVKAVIASRVLGAVPYPSWDPPLLRRVFAFGKWTWAQSLGAALFAAGDRLIVGGRLGATALAQYSVCVQLAQQIHAIPAAGAQVLFPTVSRRREAGVPTFHLIARATPLVAGFAVVLALPIALFSREILDLWVGAEVAAAAAAPLAILAIGYVILSLTITPHFVLLGAGRARFVALINIAAGLAGLAAGLVLVGQLGLVGAALTRVLYGVVVSAMFLLRSRRDEDAPDVRLSTGGIA